MKIDPISVTELNRYVKNRFDGDEYLNNVLVKGGYLILKTIIQVIYILL